MERTLDHVGAVEPAWHHHGGYRVAIPFRVAGAELETPAFEHGRAYAAGQEVVTCEDVLQAFFEQQCERFAQTVKHRERRRVREVAVLVALQHVVEIEEAATERIVRARVLLGFQGLVADAAQAQPGRQHQAFLAAGDRTIHAPLVHAEVDRPDRADAVHEQHGGVSSGVDRAPDGQHVAGHPGGGLVLHHHDRLDRVRRVRLQRVVNAFRRGAGPPLLLLDDHVEPVTLGQVDPKVAELSEARG